MTNSTKLPFKIELNEPVFDIEALWPYVTDDTFAPTLELADGSMVSVQWRKESYSQSRGPVYGEPQYISFPVSLVEVDPTSSASKPCTETDENNTPPHMSAETVNAHLRSKGGVVRLRAHHPIYVDRSVVYADEALLELRNGIDDAAGISESPVILDRMTTNDCHVTITQLENDQALVIRFTGVDSTAKNSDEDIVSVVSPSRLLAVTEGLSEIEGRIFCFLIEQSDVSAVCPLPYIGFKIRLTRFPGVIIEISNGTLRWKRDDIAN